MQNSRSAPELNRVKHQTVLSKVRLGVMRHNCWQCFEHCVPTPAGLLSHDDVDADDKPRIHYNPSASWFGDDESKR